MLPDGLLFLQRGDREVRPENHVFFSGAGEFKYPVRVFLSISEAFLGVKSGL